MTTFLVGNEEKQVFLKPEFPGSIIYHIIIDKENHGMIRKITRDWVVYLNDKSNLTNEHTDAIIRTVISSELLNN